MYFSYFVNVTTGELKYSGLPKDDPKGPGWKRISQDEYDMFCRVAQWARENK